MIFFPYNKLMISRDLRVNLTFLPHFLFKQARKINERKFSFCAVLCKSLIFTKWVVTAYTNLLAENQRWIFKWILLHVLPTGSFPFNSYMGFFSHCTGKFEYTFLSLYISFSSFFLCLSLLWLSFLSFLSSSLFTFSSSGILEIN